MKLGMSAILLGIAFFGVSKSYGDHTKPYVIGCASSQYKYTTCPTPTRIQSVSLQSVQSSAACNFGSTWGYTDTFIWVDKGCRALFTVTPVPQIVTQQISCASSQYKYNTCPVGGRIREVILLKQESFARCELNQTYGATHELIWVDRGCRGIFQVKYIPYR